MYAANASITLSVFSSVLICNEIGLVISKLKIPIIDLAFTTYLPETKSKSYSNFVISLTKDLIFSTVLIETFTDFISNTSYVCCSYLNLVKLVLLFTSMIIFTSNHKIHTLYFLKHAQNETSEFETHVFLAKINGFLYVNMHFLVLVHIFSNEYLLQ